MNDNCHVEPVTKTTPAGLPQKADLALLAIRGMGCNNCAARVRNSLLTLDGVYEVEIYLNLGMAEVSYNSQQVSSRMLTDAVSRAGNDRRHEYLAELIAIS